MNFDYQINLNRDNEWHMQRHHFHEDYEILLSLSDAGNMFVGRDLYSLKRGTLLLLNDNVLHRSFSTTAVLYERYVLHFSQETLAAISTSQTNLLSEFNTANQCIELNENELLSLATLFERCCQPKSNVFGDDLRRNIAFIELLLKVCTLFSNKDTIDSRQTPQVVDFDRVAPILEYIQSNLMKELNLDSIAEHFFMSKYHLCHIFKSSTGFSVREYIIHSRVLKARTLLRNGYSVQTAGEQAGFQNNAHFIRTFKKLSGMSPGHYKKEYLNKIKQ